MAKAINNNSGTMTVPISEMVQYKKESRNNHVFKGAVVLAGVVAGIYVAAKALTIGLGVSALAASGAGLGILAAFAVIAAAYLLYKAYTAHQDKNALQQRMVAVEPPKPSLYEKIFGKSAPRRIG